MSTKHWMTGFLCGSILTGCADAPEPTEAPITRAKSITEHVSESGTAKSGPNETVVNGFTFTVPADWTEQPPRSEFIQGEYSIPGQGGPARLTISSARGGIEENINRWRTQFNRKPNDPEPRESDITVDGKSGTLVELWGDFTEMFNPEPKRGWRLLGVAVPLEGIELYIKLTGPASTVADRRDEVIKFVESARMRKG